MKRRMIVPIVTASALLVGLTGCNLVDSYGSTKTIPDAEQEPTEDARPIPAPQEVLDVRSQTFSCTATSDANELVLIDGEYKCLTRSEQSDYNRSLLERAYATIVPLQQSYEEGASPEATMQSLMSLSCEQSLDNPHYWGLATDFYLDVLEGGENDEFATEWPNELTVALRAHCFQ